MPRQSRRNTKVANDKTAIIRSIPKACLDETAARDFLETMLWGTSPACPKCGVTDVYQMRDRKTGERQADGRWRCRGCKQQYTVRTGTILEDSRIPLRFWCHAFWRACSSKKGVSALQIKRETGLSYKSALFLMHRIRFAMTEAPGGPLGGIVEVDETYVGGKPRPGQPRYREVVKGQPELGLVRVRGWAPDFRDRKTPVLAMVERGGRVRALPPEQISGKTLKAAVRQHVDRSARIMTDENPSYTGLAHEYASHETVNHSRKEYARGDVTTNTVEGFFALLKRGVVGTFHHVSRKHLHRYIGEFEFRYNFRRTDDGTRTIAAIRAGMRKRLRYRQCVGVGVSR